MSPEEYVQQKTSRAGSSFHYAFLFLPPQRRAAMVSFYAFCREVDDAVDQVQDIGVAARTLAWWRQEVRAAYAQPEKMPSHPVLQALHPYSHGIGIEERHLQAVITGCEMDLQQQRYLDFPALAGYCHLVAGVVGEVVAGILACPAAQFSAQLTAAAQTRAKTPAQIAPVWTLPEPIVRYAHTLGLALQLTNIIRDVGEDARRGRIYLPMDDLRRHGVTAQSILDGKHSPEFETMMREQAARARHFYAEAWALLPTQERRQQKPGLMMGSIYYTLLGEIEAAHFQVLRQRIGLTPLRKFWLAWKVQALGRVPFAGMDGADNRSKGVSV